MELKKPNLNLVKRFASGFIIAVIVFGCFITGGLPLLIIVAIFMGLGATEFIKILNQKGFYPFKSVIFILSTLFICLASVMAYDLLPLLLSLIVICSFMAVMFKGRQPYMANVATTTLCCLYCGWLPAHIIMIRQLSSTRLGFLNFEMNNGIVFLFMYFFGVLLTDVGAFYFGKKFGKTKLAPVISPNKTIEGSLGGALSTMIICFVIGLYTKLPIIHIVILSLVITIFAQLGDLAESLLKRDAGVKDSGDSIPGHGGFLDRADGYVFAAPAVYYYIHYFVLDNTLITTIGKYISHVFG